MGALSGGSILLKIEGADGFTAVAGLRTKRMTLDARSVDVTDSESTGRWRELLAGAGVRTASVSGSGIFKDAPSDAGVRDAFFAGEIRRWQLLVPGFGTIAGPMQITRLEYGGAFDAEATFEIALESAGPIEFEDAA